MTDTSTRHAVVGANGEVGEALLHALPDHTLAVDVDTDTTGLQCDVMHVAIPHTSEFVAIVGGYEIGLAADIVIVHSTVPVGTCDPNGWVHSPVRGRHPDLAAGLKTFTKHVGGWRADDAADLLTRDAGLTCRVHDKAAVCEAGKLWELARFGVQVAVEHAIHDWCDQHGLPYSQVYREFGASYTAGYRELGEGDRFALPTLDHMSGPLGGHCVEPGVAMLGHSLIDFVVSSITPPQ